MLVKKIGNKYVGRASAEDPIVIHIYIYTVYIYILYIYIYIFIELYPQAPEKTH